MAKAPDAFRTISEVSEQLDTPAHVLRFWESKFAQVKPVKRAGGRRYYRPDDVMLLAGIKVLLHDNGMTIKGAQKVLREQGVKAVSAMGAPAAQDSDDDVIEGRVLPDADLTERHDVPVPDDHSQTEADAVRQPLNAEDADTVVDAEPDPDPDPGVKEDETAATSAPEPQEAPIADNVVPLATARQAPLPDLPGPRPRTGSRILGDLVTADREALASRGPELTRLAARLSDVLGRLRRG